MNPSQPIDAPRALIPAGPNGSGKTTFATEYLTAEGHCPTFLNAALIAAGLSPFAPEKANITAMRLMAERIRECVDHAHGIVSATRRRFTARNSALLCAWCMKTATGRCLCW